MDEKPKNKKGFWERHPILDTLVGIAFIVLVLYLSCTGTGGGHRTDPETGDVWGP